MLLVFTVNLIENQRPLTASPLDEPSFYTRYIYRWVKEALEEMRRLKQRE